MILQCRLADLNVEFDLKYERTFNNFSSYASNFDSADVCVCVSDEDFEIERKYSFVENGILLHDKPLETTAAFRVLAEKLPLFDAVVLHSCAFNVGDKGIALGAHSGTGKTTHMLLWQQLLGDKFTIINGDKPIIRFVDGSPYIYGSPWAGKEGLQNNIKVPLTDICQIERSLENKTIPLSKDAAINLLMKQIYMPFDVQTRLKTLELVSKIAEKVRFWKICCNMDIEAAQVAYNTIFEGK